jgi:ATP-dependent exoDNAse (exonuclease V) beta subunit
MLALQNPHPRDANIQFEEVAHKYTIADGGTYTSVTTFIKPLFEEFDADRIIAGMMKSRKWSQSKYFGMEPEDIKAQWAASGSDAAAAGTLLHADIERFYNGEAVDNTSVEYGYFRVFAASCALRPYRTEWTVYDEEVHVAGSIDMVFERPDGVLEIYDWKRTKAIEKANAWGKYGKHAAIAHLPDTNYWHYALQLNLYKFILEHKYDKQVAGLYLVRLHPDSPKYECVPVCDLQAEVRELLQVNLASGDTRDAFAS